MEKINLQDMSIFDFKGTDIENVKSPDAWYQIFKNSYHKLPEKFIEHRKYFSTRGFGEDPFHAMWFYLFEQYKPKSILEIGVYRGQTISLFSLLGKHFNLDTHVVGVGPLEAVNDSVSVFSTDINYEEDIRNNYTHFNLGEPNLVKSLSERKKARQVIKSQKWDMIYIDGHHDWPYVLADYCNCAEALSDNGIMIIDDSSLHEDYNPPAGMFKGHVGPSYILEDFAKDEMELFLTVGHNNCLRNIK